MITLNQYLITVN